MSKPAVRAAFVAVTTLFFAWGFITSLIDPLVAAVKGIFTLTDLQAQLSAFAFFIAYGLVSFPAAVLLARLRAVPTILLALAMMALACLIMLGAANLAIYSLVLLGLFVLASGITILQVAANPLAAALGDPRGSHFRLTLSQTFNSLGTFIGPFLGAVLFLEGVEVKQGTAITPEVRDAALAGIDRAYFWIAGLILLLLAFFWFSRRTVAAAAPDTASGKGLFALIGEALASRWTMFGGAAIFLYVGAEVAIGSQMALFLNSDAVWGGSDVPFAVPLLGHAMGSDGVPGVSLQEAGKAVAFYWGGCDGRSRDRLGPARALQRGGPARFVHGDRLRDVPLRRGRGRRIGRVRRARDRAVQLAHVSGDLHADARALNRQHRGDLGVVVHGDRRGRVPAAARGGAVGPRRLRDCADRPGRMLRAAVPVRSVGRPCAGLCSHGDGGVPLMACRHTDAMDAGCSAGGRSSGASADWRPRSRWRRLQRSRQAVAGRRG